MRSQKSFKIIVSNLKHANDINNCYYIQDCIINNILEYEMIHNLVFSRDKKNWEISFDIPICMTADHVFILCKEYLLVMLEQNSNVKVELEEIEDKIKFTYHISYSGST